MPDLFPALHNSLCFFRVQKEKTEIPLSISVDSENINLCPQLLFLR